MTAIRTIIPGLYYYRTRYTRLHHAIFHLLKYWGVHVLVVFLLFVPELYAAIVPGVLAWMAYQSIYDLMCYDNDRRAVQEGEGRETRDSEVWPGWAVWLMAKGLVAVACLAGALTVWDIESVRMVVAVIAAMGTGNFFYTTGSHPRRAALASISFT